MPHIATELFIQCIYSLELSYDELIDTETELKKTLTQLLDENGAQFIHFEEMGDTMRAQCVFDIYDEGLFHPICDALAPYFNHTVEAKLLFVSKDLDFLHVYTISDGKWLESVLHMPAPGPITQALREQEPQ